MRDLQNARLICTCTKGLLFLLIGGLSANANCSGQVRTENRFCSGLAGGYSGQFFLNEANTALQSGRKIKVLRKFSTLPTTGLLWSKTFAGNTDGNRLAAHTV